MRTEQRAFEILWCHGEKPWSSFWDSAEQKFSRPCSLLQAESVSAPQRDSTMLPHVLYWSVACLREKKGDIFLPSSSWKSTTVFDRSRRCWHFCCTIELIAFLLGQGTKTFLWQTLFGNGLVSKPVLILRPTATTKAKKGDQEKNEEAAMKPNLSNWKTQTS